MRAGRVRLEVCSKRSEALLESGEWSGVGGESRGPSGELNASSVRRVRTVRSVSTCEQRKPLRNQTLNSMLTLIYHHYYPFH